MRKIKLIILILSLNMISIYSQDNVSLGKIPNIDLKLLNGKKTTLYKLLKTGPVLLDFWATWCKPCKEEMPSLDKLQANPELDNIKIFAINIGKETLDKVNKFFVDFNIKNFDPYFDPPTTLAKKFSLRGVPTSILINKEGQEFARIMGSIDFEDKNFVNWIKKYN